MLLELGKIWQWLRGPKDEFSLENRILNAGGVLSALTLVLFTCYNLFVVVLPELVLPTVITLIYQLYLYYQSRFAKRFKLARNGFTVGCYIFLAVNYYYGAGINGPVLFSLFVTLIILIFIQPKWKYLYLLLHCALVIGMLSYEYQYGVVDIYAGKGERFFDIACICCLMLLLTYLLVHGVIKSYNRERGLAIARAEQLSLLHQQNTRLFSIISHDLRTPLNNISSYLELIRGQYLDEADRQKVETQLLELTNSTSDFLGNLLSWSKSQFEGTKVKLERLELNPIVKDVIAAISQMASKKQVNFKVELNAGQLVADRAMLTIVLRNLVSNAIKYSHKGGDIVISSRETDGRIELAIRDFGTGISEEKQQAILSEQMISSPGTQSESGVGLGLVLCNDFVKLQEGNIWFESTPESGSVFYLSFPL